MARQRKTHSTQRVSNTRVTGGIQQMSEADDATQITRGGSAAAITQKVRQRIELTLGGSRARGTLAVVVLAVVAIAALVVRAIVG
jgi:hypothetical protein